MTITFSLNGGTTDSGRNSVTSYVRRGDPVTPPSNVRKDGKNLLGWNTFALSVSVLTTIPNDTEDKTYYAIWQ
ncbi:MAG: InlB B-repeat-containing protein [Treponema sp.]|nr:InlB B-repeat-containing protein [Treponema sp.]